MARGRPERRKERTEFLIFRILSSHALVFNTTEQRTIPQILERLAKRKERLHQVETDTQLYAKRKSLVPDLETLFPGTTENQPVVQIEKDSHPNQ